MGVYVRDLLLGQYYFDTLFPRIPVPIMRQITAHLERMNLPTRHAGVTGDTNCHQSDDTIHAMLFGCFTESQRTKIDFSHNGISVQGMMAVDEFHDMDVISISGNFCADKKPTAVNWIEGHFH